MESSISEIHYILLIFFLFIVPRTLQRFRIPTAIASLSLGVVATIGFGLFTHDSTIGLLSSFGIIALFLFAGLDVDFQEIQRELSIITQHIIINMALLFLVAYAAKLTFSIAFRPAILLSLALTTPSTGFILDSLNSVGVDDKERFWIKTKAIGSEIIALAALFVILQSTSVEKLSASFLILVAPLFFFRSFSVYSLNQ
jgi:Kef-type K+ transport system membrane component KefB